ncbi:hypothetical protein [Streptomyces sp. NPDC001508]|uniref:hypothetical protein n=1 Tax=Streptomyces sp. NPDC001508 TaxID=3154656 RepID=UPI00331B5D85
MPVEDEVLVGGDAVEAAGLGDRLGAESRQPVEDEATDARARGRVDDPVAGAGRGGGASVGLGDLDRGQRAPSLPDGRPKTCGVASLETSTGNGTSGSCCRKWKTCCWVTRKGGRMTGQPEAGQPGPGGDHDRVRDERRTDGTL